MKVPSKKITEALNAMADGSQKSMNKIADEVHISKSLLHRVIHDFPLWEWFRKPDNFD